MLVLKNIFLFYVYAMQMQLHYNMHITMLCMWYSDAIIKVRCIDAQFYFALECRLFKEFLDFNISNL